MAIGRPGHHRPGLCCVVVLWTQAAGPEPTASAPARPLHPAACAWPCCPGRACAPDHRSKHGRPIPLPCPPAAARERRLRRAGARGAARPNASSCCAIAVGSGAGPVRTGRPGLGAGPADARLLQWRGVLQSPSRKQAGPRVPLNRILFNRHCVVAFAP